MTLTTTAISRQELQRRVQSLGWYHTIDLGQGVITPGYYDHRPYLPYYGIPQHLAGKSALDVGPASGFFSFEMERRGAQVTATELPNWEAHDFGPLYRSEMPPETAHQYLHEPFRFASEALGSSVQRRQLTIYELSPQNVGQFDLVFCGSVLLHLSDPNRALWRLQSVTRQAAILATVIRRDDNQEAVATFVGHQRGDCWWLPNRKAFELMVQSAGFRGWEWYSDFPLRARDGNVSVYHGVIRAWNSAERPAWLNDVEPLPQRQAITERRPPAQSPSWPGRIRSALHRIFS
jgi:tRNA (mo5U34)-methyltransferase